MRRNPESRHVIGNCIMD